MTSNACITRFAPSPTGYLHEGHAYSALFSQQAAQGACGKFLLRIEDIDYTRCRAKYETAIYQDLAWLGLQWETPVRRQSDHLTEYQLALDKLRQQQWIYPCFCTRKDILTEIEQSNTALPHSSELLYPGICRKLSADEQETRIGNGEEFALRLNLKKALASLNGKKLTWHDRIHGPQTARPELLGDAILARKDIHCSYHLAVVLDDSLQQISLVTRGQDLFESTHLHRLLQALLNLPVPEYAHHPLIKDAAGTRLAKRKKSPALKDLRTSGLNAKNFLKSLPSFKFDG
ncbi:MAG: tRNA glutamyl-Q(34) synthetase GluQRS [Verrucomicrobiota bacterium]